ncbi:hypothetical protein [Bradyrhizobium sp. cf659]|uniref:hypothetical protein n=1 Tax=Bradyrhizobium sp. cf659 TaxID=1761771 RepID=UPI0008E1939D|nr:hypothetical protein [Bradyrhizobium sp. cf659]SFI30946.1 hypothetical protein SAMN04487925_102656 [Bradyrhizobium sp. cf659]
MTLAAEILEIDMVDQVWISEVLSNGDLGNKLGLRQKWYDEPWEAPYVRHIVPKKSEHVRAAIFKHFAGHTLKREELPEASAVYSMSDFKRAKDVFFAGAFLAVKGRIADVLAKFDFGAGGLVPYTIYEADENTPLPGPFYLVNFGSFKDCFLPAPTSKKPVFTTRRARPIGRSDISRTATSRFRRQPWPELTSGCVLVSKVASS